MVHLHPTSKVLLNHVTSGDVGVRKNGTNGMLRRKVSIGSGRVGATGLATRSPRRSLRIQKKKEKRKLRSLPSAQGLLLETEG